MKSFTETESAHILVAAGAAGIDPYDKAAEAPYEMVSFSNSFHGRTLGALALTYKDQYKTPFSPIMPGALMVPYMDLDAAAAVIKKVRYRCHCFSLFRERVAHPPLVKAWLS